MKIVIWPLTLALVGGVASAQEAELPKAAPLDYQPCLVEHDDTKRLTCLDNALKYTKPDIPAKNQPKPLPSVLILVRQQANFDTFGGQDLMGKPGQLMVNQSDGMDTSTVKLGLIGVFRPINTLGWQPYMATAWNRDNTGKTPSDLRDIAAGITGPLWDAFEPRWTISPNVKFRHRTDLYGTKDSDALVIHGNLILLPWVQSVPSNNNFSYVFVPYFGVQAENRHGGADQGSWRSDYIGVRLNAELNMLLPRLSFATTIQHFHDRTTPIAATHRSENYTSTSISYGLTDPDDKSVTVRPALTIERDVGNDLLSGNGKVDKTVFGITLQVN